MRKVNAWQPYDRFGDKGIFAQDVLSKEQLGVSFVKFTKLLRDTEAIIHLRHALAPRRKSSAS